MIKLRKTKVFKMVAVLLVFLFLYQSDHLLCNKNNVQSEFERAKQDYIGEKFESAKRILERIIMSIEKNDKEQQALLAKAHLLLAAAQEKTLKVKEAKKNYWKAKKLWKKSSLVSVKKDKRIIAQSKIIPIINGISFDELKYYRNIMKKDKRKFPWLLVAGGVAVVAVLVYFLLIKPKLKKYTLIVTIAEGITGNPGTGTHTYKKGTVVEYSYTTQQGSSALIVSIDGSIASTSGTIKMNANHTLAVSTTLAHLESEPSGAVVFVDEQDKGMTTPCDIYIAPGSHELRLVKNSWGEAKRTITFEENKNYTISAKLSGYKYEFVTVWGSKGSGDGQFDWPRGIAVNKNNYIYVVDGHNNRIQKFDSNWKFETKWGSHGSGNGQFVDPCGIAIDQNNDVYVADLGNHRIQKFSASGKIITEWGSRGSGDGQFKWPWGIAADRSNYIYVSEYNQYRIQKFSSTGIFITKWGSHGSGNGQFDNPLGIGSDEDNYVYVCDRYNHRVQKFSSNGTFITKWGSYGTGNGQFDQPLGVAADKNSYVYVSSYFSVQKFTSDGIFITKWGSHGSGNGQFNDPNNIAVNDSGIVFVSDPPGNRIQEFRISDQTEDDGTWTVDTSNPTNRRFSNPKSPAFSKSRKEKTGKRDKKGDK